MGRKHQDRTPRPPTSDFEFERTMADAEADAATTEVAPTQPGDAAVTCICGGRQFLLEAFLHVVDGRARPDPVEVEALTCPACGREYDAIQAEGGRILRGDFRGYTDVED